MYYCTNYGVSLISIECDSELVRKRFLVSNLSLHVPNESSARIRISFATT